MLGKIIDKKLKSATLVETIVALLILMISFSAGMVIYNRILVSGVSSVQMKAELGSAAVADSLQSAPDFQDQHIQRGEIGYEVSFNSDPRYGELRVLKVIATDEGKKEVSVFKKLIRTK